jgi:mannosyltransferase OCH1-like enzyme
MARGRLTLLLPLTILALFLTGTVIVLSTISYYLAIDPSAYLTEVEIPPSAHRSSTNESLARERIPRIIHQTWKSEDLPDRWRAVSNTCRTLMPD